MLVESRRKNSRFLCLQEVSRPSGYARCVVTRNTRLAVEVAVLYFALPAAFAPFSSRLSILIFPLLISIGVGTATFLLHDPTFDRGRFLQLAPLRREWLTILGLWLFGAAAMLGFLAWLRPDLLFNLPRQHPGRWAMIMVLYPIISVIPQSLFWRALFFHRYRPLFTTDRALIVASALAFSWMHITMLNAFAMILTLAGGLLFSWRYARTKSIAVTSIEHALWGDLLFTVGLGAYFYIR